MKINVIFLACVIAAASTAIVKSSDVKSSKVDLRLPDQVTPPRPPKPVDPKAPPRKPKNSEESLPLASKECNRVLDLK